MPGIADVPLDQVSFDDNPIPGGFGRGNADVGDYRWAAETWESVVRPGVLAGKARKDFARRDTERGQHVGLRRTAGVYDMFLGDDSIRLSRRSDGSFDVVGGRHRIEVARQLGILTCRRGSMVDSGRHLHASPSFAQVLNGR